MLFFRADGRYIISLFFLSFMSICSNSFASAWSQGEGKSQLIFNQSYYNTSHFRHADSKLVNTPQFIKIEVNPYYEYGIRDNFTVGLNSSIQSVIRDSNGEREKQTRLSYLDIFFRHELIKKDHFVISYQPLIKTSGIYSDSEQHLFGKKQTDLEMRFLFGADFKIPRLKIDKKFDTQPYDGQNHFINLELAYRQHVESSTAEIRFDGTLGMRPYQQWLLLGQWFLTKSMQDDFVISAANNVITYDAVKLQYSIVRQISSNKSIQMGYYHDVWVRNAAQGDGFIFSMWYNF
ncbi:hypothetical protein N9W34_06225 [Rickettsiales bacterium]|nr:hypothetical protein [Rickettsiales bacterium]